MKPFTSVGIAVFSVVALAHLLRILLGWTVTVNGILIPFWLSVIACGVSATLAVMLWRENRK
jgi:hypothetical protein